MTGPVVDEAKILSSETARELDFTIRRLQEAGGPQVNVVTVSNLGGLPIEAASIRISDSWKLGDRMRDDGVILLIAMTERKIRIEVGQGLEAVLTDLDSRRIIDEQMIPHFRTGQADFAVLAGAKAIINKVAPAGVEGEFAAMPARQRQNSGSIPMPILVLFIAFLIIMSRLQKRGRYRRFRGYDARRSAGGWTSGGGYWSGGSGGSGGFSGGGWSGGGGGFSGGGASGGW